MKAGPGNFKDPSLWPKPYQQPHPPICDSSDRLEKRQLDWAGARNYAIALPEFPRGLIEDVIGYYSKAVARGGNKVSPNQITLFADAYVADSSRRRDQGNTGRITSLFRRNMLFGHGNGALPCRSASCSARNAASYDYVRPENRGPLDDTERGEDRQPSPWPMPRNVRPSTARLAWGSAERGGSMRLIVGRRACRRQQLCSSTFQSRRHAA